MRCLRGTRYAFDVREERDDSGRPEVASSFPRGHARSSGEVPLEARTSPDARWERHRCSAVIPSGRARCPWERGRPRTPDGSVIDAAQSYQVVGRGVPGSAGVPGRPMGASSMQRSHTQVVGRGVPGSAGVPPARWERHRCSAVILRWSGEVSLGARASRPHGHTGGLSSHLQGSRALQHLWACGRPTCGRDARAPRILVHAPAHASSILRAASPVPTTLSSSSPPGAPRLSAPARSRTG